MFLEIAWILSFTEASEFAYNQQIMIAGSSIRPQIHVVLC